jgi:acetolactate synthase I/III small subunit
MPEHTLLVLLRDNPGALHRAVTLFRRRGYNIRSLHVDRSETPGVSRMDVSFEAPPPNVTQLARELERFIDVLSVRNVTRHPAPAFVPNPSAPTSLPTNRTQADGVCDEEDIAV